MVDDAGCWMGASFCLFPFAFKLGLGLWSAVAERSVDTAF
jgi:hypothetical protein